MYSGAWYIKQGGGRRIGNLLDLGAAGRNGALGTRRGRAQKSRANKVRNTDPADVVLQRTAASWVAEDGPPPP